VAQIIDRIRMLDDQPLSVCRSANARLIVVCRHFTVLFAALLRETGIPARGRCGFGIYFRSGRFVDHWVCEYWNAPEARWVLVDAFIAAPQREKLRPDFDPLDVPRDRFVVAGDAWALCRVGNINPSAFGIHDLSGMWFVAGSLMRDLAALNKMEMLPWDVWGVMPREGWSPTHDQLALFDRVASQTRTPDAAFGELRESYADDRVRVPAIVFNALRRRSEAV
jgi:Transglutaminase-like superfamily